MSSPQYALGMTVPEAVSGGVAAGPMARRPATAGGERPSLQRVGPAKSPPVISILILQSSAALNPKLETPNNIFAVVGQTAIVRGPEP